MPGSIVKRPSKRKRRGKQSYNYYVVIDGEWITVDEPKTQAHAEEVLHDENQRRLEGAVRSGKMAFEEFKDVWMKDYAEAEEISEHTLADYRGIFKNHLMPEFGFRRVDKISIQDIQKFKANQLDKELSAQSVKHHLRLLRQMLKHAVEWGYIRTNPAMKVRYPTVTRKQMDPLKPDEVRDFLSTEVDHQRYTFFLTTICGGLRESEVIGARWRDLNWRSGQYYVRQQWARPNPGVPAHFEEPKTKSSVAPVDLAPECLHALKVHKANQAEDRLTAGEEWEDNDLIFCLLNGRPLDHWNVVKRWFRPALTEAGLRMVRFHDLRHTCASILIDNNENPKYIQKQMRHASINMTFDTYGHLFEDKNPESAARFGSSIFGSERSKKDLRSGENSG